MNIKIEFDPDKDARNIEERGISFNDAAYFDWDSALIWEDTRKDYKEHRYIALGFIDSRLHALVFTPRNDAIRAISSEKSK